MNIDILDTSEGWRGTGCSLRNIIMSRRADRDARFWNKLLRSKQFTPVASVPRDLSEKEKTSAWSASLSSVMIQFVDLVYNHKMNSQITKGQTYRNSWSERLGWETTASLKRTLACWMKKLCKDDIGTIKDLAWTIQIIEKNTMEVNGYQQVVSGYQHSWK